METPQTTIIPFIRDELRRLEQRLVDSQRRLGRRHAFRPRRACLGGDFPLQIPGQGGSEEKQEELVDVAVDDIHIGQVVRGEWLVTGVELVSLIAHLLDSYDLGLELGNCHSGLIGEAEDGLADHGGDIIESEFQEEICHLRWTRRQVRGCA